MTSPKSLTIGIPCYNESITIGKVIADFRQVFPASAPAGDR